MPVSKGKSRITLSTDDEAFSINRSSSFGNAHHLARRCRRYTRSGPPKTPIQVDMTIADRRVSLSGCILEAIAAPMCTRSRIYTNILYPIHISSRLARLCRRLGRPLLDQWWAPFQPKEVLEVCERSGDMSSPAYGRVPSAFQRCVGR